MNFPHQTLDTSGLEKIGWHSLDRMLETRMNCRKSGRMARKILGKSCGEIRVPDEGYFSTVLCLLGFPLDEFVEKKASTWTHWEGGPHPLSHETLSDDHLRSILESGALFARKFPQGADVGTFGLHR